MEKELDISVNLSSFFLKNIGLWIADDSTNERRRKGMLAYTVWCTFFSTIISSRDLYFTWIYNGVRVYYICMKLPTVTVSVYELAFWKKMCSTKVWNLFSFFGGEKCVDLDMINFCKKLKLSRNNCSGYYTLYINNNNFLTI